MNRLAVTSTFLLLMSVWSACTAGPSAESTADGLTFRVSLAKRSYLVGEPVVATFALRNGSSREAKLAEPGWMENVVSYRLRKLSGSKDLPRQLELATPATPEDYGWMFRAGETRTSEADLTAYFLEPLPAGTYGVRATYRPEDHVKGVWHGTITTSEITFSVVDPAGPGGKAAQKFRAARMGSQRRVDALAAAKELAMLADSHTAGVFAQYAGFWEAVAYQTAGKTQDYLEKMARYAERHPDAPFYGMNARRLVGRTLYYEKRYTEAKAALAGLPDGYEKQSWIRDCDKALAEKH